MTLQLLSLPFFVGIFAIPLAGVLLDYVETKRVLAFSACVTLTGSFLLGQAPGYYPAALLFAGLQTGRLAGVLLIQRAGQGNGQDRYGKLFSIAGGLEVVGVLFALQITNLSWAEHYVAGKKCLGMCVDFKFAFHLVCPVICVLATSLSLLARVPQLCQHKDAAAAASSSLSPTNILIPRSGSGARLTYVLACFFWSGWATLFFFGAGFVTKELYVVYNPFREDLRPLGNPMLRFNLKYFANRFHSAPQPLTDDSKLSYAFTSSFAYLLLFAALLGCVLLYRITDEGHYLISRIYSDVGNNLFSANLFLPFLFATYPLKLLLNAYALSLGLCLAVQLVLPPLLVTRFVSPNALSVMAGNSRSRYLAGLLWTQNLAFLAAKHAGTFLYTSTGMLVDLAAGSYAAVFVCFAAVLFAVNLLLAGTIAAKEEELTRVKMGLLESVAPGGVDGGGQE
eukprot:g17769.t1